MSLERDTQPRLSGPAEASSEVEATDVQRTPRPPPGALAAGIAAGDASGAAAAALLEERPTLRRFSAPPTTASRTSDATTTHRMQRVDVTPAPLPPAPAPDGADGWFEQGLTNPADVPDLAALAGMSTGTGRMSRVDLETARPEAAPAPAQVRYPWLVPALLGATCLVVGMVLGALLFGGRSDPHPAAAIECPAPPR